MTTAPVRELKNRLSLFLRLVKEGETVLVTEHGRVIAELHRPDREEDARDGRFERFLDGLEQAGRLRKAQRSRSIVRALPPRPRGGPDWRKVLEQLREDRYHP
jgi:antitoxin (DNA-binding transcriptional repressor) of toxin-antitoxin stability system